MSNSPKLPLIIFDVDGTLVGGESNDWSAFGDAYEQVAGTPLDIDLFERLNDVTAHSVIHAALTEAGEPDPLPVIQKVAATYADILAAKIAANPNVFCPTEGAIELLHELDHRGYDRAVATGDWEKSIRLKLDLVGIPYQSVPLATSSDRPTRSTTIALAAERAGRDLTETVYVGDGTWDYRATQSLGIPFIGTGARPDALRAAGAQVILSNLHPDNFFPALEQALQA